ncbi:hypothetical protein SM89_02279 [Klebsiella quasipneumoniae]|nr:hypothetical protein SM89_02279 [Klebsiella quasipneumoniae]
MIGVKKLQDFSKAMIGPVLYLPAIGLLIALFSMTTNRLWVDESSGIYLLGKFVSSMLWALMNNLGFLFCLGLASGLAKTRKAEAAFVAAMTWLVYLAANNSWLTLTHRLATGATNAQLYMAADKPISSVFRSSIWACSSVLSLAAPSPLFTIAWLALSFAARCRSTATASWC